MINAVWNNQYPAVNDAHIEALGLRPQDGIVFDGDTGVCAFSEVWWGHGASGLLFYGNPWRARMLGVGPVNQETVETILKARDAVKAQSVPDLQDAREGC